MQFTVGTALSQGWEVMKRNYGTLLGVSLVYLLISLAFSIPFIGLLVALVVAGPLAAGLSYTGIRAYRGQVEFGDLFSGFHRFGETLGIFWILFGLGILTLIPVILGAAVGAVLGVEGFGVATLVVGGIVSLALYIYVAIRFSLSMQYCMDVPGIGVVDSLKSSWRATEPHVGTLFGLGVVMFFITLGLAILLYLPLIFLGMPLGLGVGGAVFVLISGRTGQEAAPPPPPPLDAGADQGQIQA